MKSLSFACLALLLPVMCLLPSSLQADDAGVEFFERKVRPVLVQHCYSCHSKKAKKARGGLYLDSRAALLSGGDSGPALVPGDPEKSRLIEAIHYKNVDLQMPPRGKLPERVIADLSAWVKQGAPWPAESVASAGAADNFDLQQRKKAHWSWQPLRPVPPPPVQEAHWANQPIDRFLLARLEAANLRPAASADRSTLLRRLSYDLTGLPPTAAELQTFLTDSRPDAVERVVDRLLASPRFGEKWARHWLDLVRYAESRGHEFDYDIPNAYHYRDYVIRALNDDLPYNQFVTEHLAGDLLTQPRRHPVEGFNESILGSAFWYLGEEVHSPVDVRGDQADRFDNRIDVFSKTFLGLTVACARCHDHKFDAISTRDYYALFGVLSSTSYRLARFDTMEQERRCAEELRQVRERGHQAIRKALAGAVRPIVTRSADYLLAAREVVQAGVKLTGTREIVFEDFESGTYKDWEVTGTAFGERPQTLQTIAPYQGKINAQGKYFVNSHNIRNGENGIAGDAHKGRMRSRKFTIELPYITFLVGGGAHVGKTCVNLLIEDKVVQSATGRNDNQMYPVRWNVRRWQGKTAQMEIVDAVADGWGNIGVDHIVFTCRAADGQPQEIRAEDLDEPTQRKLREVATAHRVEADLLARWVAHLLQAARQPADPLHGWMGKRVPATQRESVQESQVVYDAARTAPWLADGFAFGSGPTRIGDLRLTQGDALRFVRHSAAEYDPIWKGLPLTPGTQNDPGAIGRLNRAGRTWRTPTFRLGKGRLHVLVRGSGMIYSSVGSHILIAGPLHGRLVQMLPASPEYRWVSIDLSVYAGLDAHLEFTPESEDFAIAQVVQADQTPVHRELPSPALVALLASTDAPDRLAAGYQRMFTDVIDRLGGEGLAGDTERASLADWLVQHGALFGLDRAAGQPVRDAIVALRKEERRLSEQLNQPSRLIPAPLDGNGIDERVFIRGSHKSPGPVVPRRFLEALVGDQPLDEPGSGRLALARQVTDPHCNPFLSRVLVNRLWHHLFGRGIVASVDDFGVMGQAPSHPELLDWLADRLVQEGWSIKKMIRLLVLSRTYQMASTRDESAQSIDSDNVLLHRANVRRLSGEALRDTLLALSGRLDEKMFGPSIPVHLTEFQEGRGRPASGPLDGAGRRSIYLGVRRNFLSPLLLTFDTPTPFSTVGRRTVSNVPAQSLILMNDPFIHQQAQLWAQTLRARSDSDAERIEAMYLAAFARQPDTAERAACLDFLTSHIDRTQAWTDLAHALINVKEFIYLR